MSYQFEIALRQFIAAFDGTNSISQADFQSRFDNLYHKNYTFYPKDEKVAEEDGFITTKTQVPLARNEVFVLEANKLASGTKMTLIHIRKIGLNCLDVKLIEENFDWNRTLHIVTTITDKKAIICKEIDDSFENSNPFFPAKKAGALCSSTVYKCKEFGEFQVNRIQEVATGHMSKNALLWLQKYMSCAMELRLNLWLPGFARRVGGNYPSTLQVELGHI